MRTRIKFCGCTRAEDALAAVEAGADAIGVIFAEESPRHVTLDDARALASELPPFVERFAVFVDPAPELVLEALRAGYTPQYSGGGEGPDVCEAPSFGPYVKVHHLAPGGMISPVRFRTQALRFPRATWMFETKVAGKSGGTGQAFPWELAAELAAGRRFVVSGGLTPENVGDCIRRVRPYAVDVRSGIETGGVKDLEKMHAFVRSVKEADAEA